ncbi:MAG: hypothetical protein JSR71_07720 [Proteobacteria bacterium]|nr:hypothetical protein [Pseudomonadota bacterium]
MGQILKWCKDDFIHNTPMEPKKPASTVLKSKEEAKCVAFKRKKESFTCLLPLIVYQSWQHERSTKMIAVDFLRNLLKARALQNPHCSRPATASNSSTAPVKYASCISLIASVVNMASNTDSRNWTNGQVERMNRTIKETLWNAINCYDSLYSQPIENSSTSFVMVYNFARRLKTLKSFTPYEYICKIWAKEPEQFNFSPSQHIVGLNP